MYPSRLAGTSLGGSLICTAPRWARSATTTRTTPMGTSRRAAISTIAVSLRDRSIIRAASQRNWCLLRKPVGVAQTSASRAM